MSDVPRSPIGPDVPPGSPAPDSAQAPLLAEYNTLREEIFLRMKTRRQEMTAALILLGVLLTFCTGENGQPLILLAFPLFVVFFAMRFTTDDGRIFYIGQYIRLRIEPLCAPLYWENHFHAEHRGPELEVADRSNAISLFGKDFRLTRVAAAGIFIGSEISAIVVGIGMLLADKGPLLLAWSTPLLILDAFAIRFTWNLLKKRML